MAAVGILISPTPGFIAQMTGRLTNRRYHSATIYVDASTGYGYVNLQVQETAKETIQGKHAFEEHMGTMGVTVKIYHSNNGIFKANKWQEDCHKY